APGSVRSHTEPTRPPPPASSRSSGGDGPPSVRRSIDRSIGGIYRAPPACGALYRAPGRVQYGAERTRSPPTPSSRSTEGDGSPSVRPAIDRSIGGIYRAPPACGALYRAPGRVRPNPERTRSPPPATPRSSEGAGPPSVRPAGDRPIDRSIDRPTAPVPLPPAQGRRRPRPPAPPPSPSPRPGTPRREEEEEEEAASGASSRAWRAAPRCARPWTAPGARWRRSSPPSTPAWSPTSVWAGSPWSCACRARTRRRWGRWAPPSAGCSAAPGSAATAAPPASPRSPWATPPRTRFRTRDPGGGGGDRPPRPGAGSSRGAARRSQGARERVAGLRRAGRIPEGQAAVGVQDFVAELLPDRWFDLVCLILDDPARGLRLETFTQATPLPLDAVRQVGVRVPLDPRPLRPLTSDLPPLRLPLLRPPRGRVPSAARGRSGGVSEDRKCGASSVCRAPCRAPRGGRSGGVSEDDRGFGASSVCRALCRAPRGDVQAASVKVTGSVGRLACAERRAERREGGVQAASVKTTGGLGRLACAERRAERREGGVQAASVKTTGGLGRLACAQRRAQRREGALGRVDDSGHSFGGIY
uniref:Uncharacterized protein n=1 Tax=Ornithorhynchus anatinus TaxID=9258 RepID=A0A6I8N4I8_ORNAN